MPKRARVPRRETHTPHTRGGRACRRRTSDTHTRTHSSKSCACSFLWWCVRGGRLCGERVSVGARVRARAPRRRTQKKQASRPHARHTPRAETRRCPAAGWPRRRRRAPSRASGSGRSATRRPRARPMRMLRAAPPPRTEGGRGDASLSGGHREVCARAKGALRLAGEERSSGAIGCAMSFRPLEESLLASCRVVSKATRWRVHVHSRSIRAKSEGRARLGRA